MRYHNYKTLFSAFILLLVLFAVPVTSSSQSNAVIMILKGWATEVVKGDTIKILADDKGMVTISLYACSSPNKTTAAESLSKMILGRHVTAYVTEKLSGSHFVALVVTDNDVNLEMLKEGMVTLNKKHLKAPLIDKYVQAEEEARKYKRGLWNK